MKVKFGVLLPERPVSRTDHPCTTLSIARAEEWLIAEDTTSFSWTVDGSTSSRSSGSTQPAIRAQFEYRNSQCSDIYGPVHAMEIFYRGAGCRADHDPKSRGVEEIQVFYGPCCKYALSPVGRFAKVWNVPVITPGGLTSGFNNMIDYIMLTSFVAPYEKVAWFVKALLDRYDWWHLSFFFHDNLGPDKVLGYPMCYDIMNAVSNFINARDKRTPPSGFHDPTVNDTATEGNKQGKCCELHREIFNENYYDDYPIDEMLGKIRNASRGKCIINVNEVATFTPRRKRRPRHGLELLLWQGTTTFSLKLNAGTRVVIHDSSDVPDLVKFYYPA